MTAGGHDDARRVPDAGGAEVRRRFVMTYSYCERLMWAAIAPAAFRYLARQELGWDIFALKQRSMQLYRQMVSRTPDIGSMMKNPLRVCPTGGMLWLSIYKAAEETTLR